jgi:hypothetical protein
MNAHDSRAGLPDGKLLVYLMIFCYLCGQLVYFIVIWYVFLVLVRKSGSPGRERVLGGR